MRLLPLLAAFLLASTAASAQALFPPFTSLASIGAGGGVVGLAMRPVTFYGKIKPTGPIELNRHSPYAPMVSIYDRGDGVYINGANENAVNNGLTYAGYNCGGGAPFYGFTGPNSTPYGTAGLWPGLSIQTNCSEPGLGAWVNTGADTGGGNRTGLDINKASDLINAGAGAGYSVALQVMRISGNVNADFEMYGGRTWISDGEGWPNGMGPGIMWGFVENAPSGGGNLSVGAYVTTGTVNSPQQTVLGTFTITPNVYYSLQLDCINISAGTSNCEWLINGVVQSGGATSVTVPSTTNTGETQVQVGSTHHDSGLSNHACACYGYKLDFIPRKLSLGEWAVETANPWIAYKPLGAP